MVEQRILDDVVARIVDVAEPEKIILFGSAARGDAGPNSDLDLLVIKDGVDELDLMARIYRRLHGTGAAVVVVVVSPADVERFKDSHALVIKPALREGWWESPYMKRRCSGHLCSCSGADSPKLSGARMQSGRRPSGTPQPNGCGANHRKAVDSISVERIEESRAYSKVAV